MRLAGIEGTRRRRVRTTRPEGGAVRPADLVERDFSATEPNRLWVTDLTYAATWAGVAYVCFIVDAYSRRIVGWRVAAHMRTSMVLDALEMARASRATHLAGLVAHSDAGSQFTSLRWGERLAELGAVPSVGSVGDSYDNALAETVNGLYKTELIRGPTGGPGATSTTPNSPPWAGSTGTTPSTSTNSAPFPQSALSAIPTTTPSPRPSTASTRPNSSADPPGALAQRRRRRTRHLGLGPLAQHPAPPQPPRRHPASRDQRGLRWPTSRPRTGWKPINRASNKPSAIQGKPRPQVCFGVTHEAGLRAEPQQSLQHRQSHQLRIRQFRRDAHHGPRWRPLRVCHQQIINCHIQCRREGVQVRVHVETSKIGACSHPRSWTPSPTTPRTPTPWNYSSS